MPNPFFFILLLKQEYKREKKWNIFMYIKTMYFFYFSWTSAKLLSEVISTALANSRQIVESFIITIHVSEVLLLFKSREKSSFSTFAFWGRSFLSISTFNFLAGLFCMHLLLWLLLWCTRQPFEWNLISSEFDQKIAFGSYFSFQQLKIKIST